MHDNMFTSARITTLFAEATRMSQPWCFYFSPKLLREEYKHDGQNRYSLNLRCRRFYTCCWDSQPIKIEICVMCGLV